MSLIIYASAIKLNQRQLGCVSGADDDADDDDGAGGDDHDVNGADDDTSVPAAPFPH